MQIGDLAVYFGNEPDIGLVIHVHTLTKFDRAIPDGEWTQGQLLAWCWKVQQSLPEHWNGLSKADNSNYAEINPDFKDVILNHCLGINPGS